MEGIGQKSLTPIADIGQLQYQHDQGRINGVSVEVLFV